MSSHASQASHASHASPASATPELELTVVLFNVGSCCAAVEASQIRATRPMPAAQADGFMHDIDHTIAYITAQETLNFPGATGFDLANAPTQLLFIKQAQHDHAMQVNTPIEIINLPANAIHPLPPLLAARCQLRGLRALALHNAQLIPLFNLVDLIEAKP
jgi:hypothetical protein